MQNMNYQLYGGNLMNSKDESREMYSELALLVNGISQVFSLTEEITSNEIENGGILLTFEKNEVGKKFIIAQYGEQRAQLFFEPPNKIRTQLIEPI
ncbi:MAG: hypothetical protein CMM25_09750 [Rhodospirillaceae bacterium]|nr:hypothetical protein [Rhodospirillaceae bacterium]|tara:strand:- start:2055 stop:2342 length:288 start_codon:yes stop_codon:yes gene_type:complete